MPADHVSTIVSLVDASEPRCGPTHLLCIDGPSGSGKTTLARDVADALSAPTVHMDDLYPGWDGLRAGTHRAHEWVVVPLRAGRPARYRRWDWHQEAYAEWVQLPASDVVVLEGCGSAALPTGSAASVVVWVEAEASVRRARGVARDPGFAQFWDSWAAQERRLYDADRTWQRADLVVDTTEHSWSTRAAHQPRHNRFMEPADMMAGLTASMQERTGRTLEAWVEAVKAAGLDPLDQGRVRAWLRDVHGVPQNSQWAIADAAATGAGWQRPDPDGYTDTLYAGPKAHLRPIHDAVITLAVGLGDDTKREGRGTYIPVVRKTQFVAVAPGPGDTVRVGFRFREAPPQDERLSPAKGFAQATHWLHLASDADEDDLRSLEPLLEAAYLQNG